MSELPTGNPYESPDAPIADQPALDLESRARTVRTFLFLEMAMVFVGLMLSTLGEQGAIEDGGPGRETPGRALLIMVVGGAILVVHAGAIFTFTRWLHSAYLRAERYGARPRYSAEASVLWWFVPVANLWMPALVMDELWRVSRDDSAGERTHTAALIVAWWIGYLLFLASAVMLYSFVRSGDRYELALAAKYVEAGSTFASAFLAARIVGAITSGQARWSSGARI